MSISIDRITEIQAIRVESTDEGQFSDVKAIEIAPAKLTKTISAFANSDGGDLFIGIDEIGPAKQRRWRGFADVEGVDQLDEALAVRPGDPEAGHVADIEQSGGIAGGLMLLHDPAVLDRHIPAAEFDHFGPQLTMAGVERCLFHSSS